MKRTLFFSLITLPFFIFNSRTVKAQSAVYYCPQMGAVGYSFSDDETGRDLEQIKQNALKDCMDHGGKSCTLLYETPKVGWGGFVRGKDMAGNLIIKAVGHQLSETFARSELKRKYLADNGVEFNDVLMVIWRAD